VPVPERTGKPLVPRDFKAAFKRFRGDLMNDHAAGLTYYSLLSLFPALLFAVALLGFVGQQGLIADTADYLKTAGAPPWTPSPRRSIRRRSSGGRRSPRS
jgi:membrane protein